VPSEIINIRGLCHCFVSFVKPTKKPDRLQEEELLFLHISSLAKITKNFQR